MKNFKDLVEEELLNEMPYVLVDTNDKRFDLEIEKFINTKDLEGFVEKIKNLLKGHQDEDKYKNIAQLSSSKDKQNFIENLKRDKIMPLALWKLFVHWMSSISSETA
jgi:hypothetical protein